MTERSRLRAQFHLERIAAALGLLMLGLAAMSAAAQPASSRRRVALQAQGTVWIRSGWMVRGSTTAELEYAQRLCARTEARESLMCNPQILAMETPARRVFVSAFGIDRTEVTHRQWRRCVRRGVCAPSRVREGDRRSGAPDHPVAGVTWSEAQQYCRFVGGRLPYEVEWERAARGSDRRHFPWGSEFNSRLANYAAPGDGMRDGFRYAAPVGSYSDAASPFGVLDMAGNVWEWTADGFAENYYVDSPTVDPHAPGGTGRYVIRGGSWSHSPVALRVAARLGVPQAHFDLDLGFRCAYDAPPGRRR